MSLNDTIKETVCELILRAETTIPADVKEALEEACKCEEGLARLQIETILENIRVAEEKKIPLCQDTGVLVFYVELGSESGFSIADVKEGITAAVRKATEEIPLRPNIVHPLSRENSGDNTGWGTPIINLNVVDESDCVKITVLPKGAGSENMSCLSILLPGDGREGMVDFVVDAVKDAEGRPCPPTIVGVGVGGTADHCMQLAKKALLRPLYEANPDKDFALLEERILSEVNGLGVGPMGLGGKTTCLGVNIEFAGCHTASLPVAVNLQCWAARRACVKISDGGAEWLS